MRAGGFGFGSGLRTGLGTELGTGTGPESGVLSGGLGLEVLVLFLSGGLVRRSWSCSCPEVLSGGLVLR